MICIICHFCSRCVSLQEFIDRSGLDGTERPPCQDVTNGLGVGRGSPNGYLLAGEAGTGNVVEAVRHCRAVMGAIKQLQMLDEDEIYVYAKVCIHPFDVL